MRPTAFLLCAAGSTSSLKCSRYGTGRITISFFAMGTSARLIPGFCSTLRILPRCGTTTTNPTRSSGHLTDEKLQPVQGRFRCPPAAPQRRRAHNPLNFLTAIVRGFVATRCRSASAASSPPTPSSFGRPDGSGLSGDGERQWSPLEVGGGRCNRAVETQNRTDHDNIAGGDSRVQLVKR